MDMHTLDMEVFSRSLTNEEIDASERDEQELKAIMDQGWSEETAVRFARAMLLARRAHPDATVEGIVEVALMVGLSFVGSEKILARLMQRHKDDVLVYGIERRHGNDNGRGARPTVESVAASTANGGAFAGKRKQRGVRGI
jgi:hypothetical protein